MSKKIIQYNNFEIDVVKRDDNIMITCHDKRMNKLYQESFSESYAFNVLSINNLNNFINIINHCFDNNTFVIVSDNDNIIINIIYNDGLSFNFNLVLQLKRTQIPENNTYVKKLEKRVEELEKHVGELKQTAQIRYVNSNRIHGGGIRF